MPQNSHFKFIKNTLVLSIFIASSILIFNWLVDPLKIFNSPLIAGFNEVKTELSGHERLYKAIELSNQKPKVIFLGSSRVMIGLDPLAYKNFSSKNAYNAAFSGATMEELSDFLMHALLQQPELEEVFLGIDFFSFNQKDSVSTKVNYSITLQNINTLLFTTKIISDSLSTIKKNLMDNPTPIFSKNGHYNLELAKDPSKNPILIWGEEKFLNLILNSKTWYQDYQPSQKQLEFFKQIVVSCRENNIALHVFINPAKACYWENLYQTDYWDRIETLKCQLCSIHPIWDFSGFNSITTEQDPNNTCYIDCSHYTPYVGNLILATFSGQYSFGYLLTPETVETSLQKIKKDRETWIKR